MIPTPIEFYTLSLHDALPISYQVFERYVAMAREAQSGGDRVAAENLYQHAEHYFRMMNAQGEGQGQPPRPMTPADVRSEEHTSELQSRQYLVCRLLLEKKKTE